MLGGYAMGLSAEMGFFCYLIIFSYGAAQRLRSGYVCFLYYIDPLLPPECIFLSSRKLLYFYQLRKLIPPRYFSFFYTSWSGKAGGESKSFSRRQVRLATTRHKYSGCQHFPTVATLAPLPPTPLFPLLPRAQPKDPRLHKQGPRKKMTDRMEWMDNFEDEIGKWIEEIDFSDIMAEAQRTKTQCTQAAIAPPAEDPILETGEQQPPYTEAEMDYALRAITLVQQALPLMNEAFRVRADAQDEEIAKLKEVIARLEVEKDTGPAPPWVVIDNSGRRATTRVSKRPRAPRRKGTEGQEEARRAHRAFNAKKWRAKERRRRDRERQGMQENADYGGATGH